MAKTVKTALANFESAATLLTLPNLHPFCFANMTKNLGIGGDDPSLEHVRFTNVKVASYPCTTGEPCETLVVTCRLEASVSAFVGPDLPAKPAPFWSGWHGGDTEPCESSYAGHLNGILVVDRFVLLVKKDDPVTPIEASSWRLRGIHAGDFVWTCLTNKTPNGLVVRGRMSGTNGTGMVRGPVSSTADGKATQTCTESCNAALLHGQVAGVVTLPQSNPRTPAEVKALADANVVASYRIYYDPGPADGGSGFGTVGRGVLNGVVMRNCA